ncbi:MAG: zinc ribbon domain-containing protein [Phycisphaerales bacterium]|nr:zinc ribbon domain-containing protein [Phycisphaerales bacterium]
MADEPGAPQDAHEDQRLRALDLRTEDVVLLRLIASLAIRIVGIVFAVLGVTGIIGLSGWTIQAVGAGVMASGEVALLFVGPLLHAAAGVGLVLFAGWLTRKLVPTRMPAARCPSCGYTITTLDAGRCTECGYLVSPLREAPKNAADRFLVAHAIVAIVVRLCGIGLVIFGAVTGLAYYSALYYAMLVLVAVGGIMLETASRAEEYEAGRQMLWWGIAIVLGLVTFSLADWIGRLALLGLRRGTRAEPNREP